jgi:hypothetical protein
MNQSKIAKLIVKASKLKRAGKDAEYLAALKSLKNELEIQKREIEQGIAIVRSKIAEAQKR